MPYDDDFDDQPSSSSSQYFESRAQAERQKLQQKLKTKGLQHDAGKQGSLSDLKRDVLMSQIAGKKDAEKKREESKDKHIASMGTKTREQEIKESKLTADTKPTADKIVKQDKADAKTQEELKKQESATEEA